MVETWKVITGYENYEVSDQGRVRSLERYEKCNGILRRRNEKIIKQSVNKYGYPFVSLSKNGIRVVRTVHRLVAEAFLPNPQNFPQVNHKDEDKTNNVVSNLEWCDASYNVSYSQGRPVSAIKDNIVIETYRDSAEAMRKTGIEKANIRRVCDGVRKTAGGLHWVWA